MGTELFALTEYCSVHDLDASFVESLEQEGLIIVTRKQESMFVDEDQLPRLEMFTRWHRDMGVNLPGIDAMRHLLDRLKDTQDQLNTLRWRLRLYEGDDQPAD